MNLTQLDFCKAVEVCGIILVDWFDFFFYDILFIFGCVGLLCAWAFSSCGEQGLLFVAVRGLLIAVASLVVEHGL